MNSERTLERSISIGTVKDLIETWLRTTRFINDKEEVTINFEYNMLVSNQHQELLPMNVTIRKDEGVVSRRIDGG